MVIILERAKVWQQKFVCVVQQQLMMLDLKIRRMQCRESFSLFRDHTLNYKTGPVTLKFRGRERDRERSVRA